MAASLKKASALIGNTRTLVLTATAGIQTIIIGGTISNIDATEAYHGVTVEVQALDSNYTVLVKNAPVSVGGSLILPKFVLGPGEKIYMTADAASFIQAYVSYVEKT